MRATDTRLRRLEAATLPRSRMVVVDGYSDAEHDEKIAALKAKGEASDRDLIICIRRFGNPAQSNGAWS